LLPAATSLGKELDPSDVGAIADPMTHLQDPGIPPRSSRKTGPDLSEEASERLAVLDPTLHQPAGVKIAPPSQRNELLGERAKLLGLGLRGDYPTMLEETRCHVVQHGALVSRCARELATLGAVPH